MYELTEIQKLLLSTGIKVRRPYPTQDELDKVRSENPGACVWGSFGAINVYKPD